MRRFTILMAVLALGLVSLAAPAFAAKGGVPGSPITDPFIWAGGEQYAAIVQGALKFNGNEKSYDLFYVFPNGEQTPISEAAPGDANYNGGRWVPVPVTWNEGATVVEITSEAELLDHAAAGHLTIGEPNYDAAFLCPLIPAG